MGGVFMVKRLYDGLFFIFCTHTDANEITQRTLQVCVEAHRHLSQSLYLSGFFPLIRTRTFCNSVNMLYFDNEPADSCDCHFTAQRTCY